MYSNIDTLAIIEALESTAPNRRDKGSIFDPKTPDAVDYRLWRDRLMRFLEELDADMDVATIRTALEEYEG